MEMGVPDKEKSKNGRGNPHGIPYLYLSTNKETTLHELRANYFDVASLGIFTINKNQNLNLVDFTPQTKHFIDTNNIVEYFKSYLLKKKIRYDFDKPLRHFDSIIEYYPTQFICEFIKVHCKGIDGILYPSSVYSKGRNIILFNNEKVSCIDVKECRVVDIKLKVEYY